MGRVIKPLDLSPPIKRNKRTGDLPAISTLLR